MPPSKLIVSVALSLPLALLLLLLQLCVYVSAQPPIDAISATRTADTPLLNVRVRCCVVKVWPYVYNITRGEGRLSLDDYKGWSIDTFKRLSNATGMKCESVKEFATKSGQSHNDFVDMLARCTLLDGTISRREGCDCDFGISGWWETPERTGVNFLPASGFDSMQVVVHVDNSKSSQSDVFFLRAFDSRLWLAIFVLFIVFISLKMLDKRFMPLVTNDVVDADESLANQSLFAKCKTFFLTNRQLHRLRCSFQSTASTMIGYSPCESGGEVPTTRMWVLNMVIALSGLFLVLTYESSMTASLVDENRRADFSSLADFKKCHVADERVCLLRYSSVEDFWNSNIAVQQCRRNTNMQPTYFDTIQEMADALYAKNCSYILLGSGTAEEVTHSTHCGKLVKAGPSFLPRDVSFITAHNWKHTGALRKAVLEQRERGDGTMLSYIDREFPSCASAMDAPALNFDNLRVFFIIAFVCCGLVLLQMVVYPLIPEAAEDKLQADAGEGSEEIQRKFDVEELESWSAFSVVVE